MKKLVLALAAVLLSPLPTSAETSQQWLQVQIAYAGHAQAEPKGSLIDVGFGVGTENLYWKIDAGMQVALLQEPVAPWATNCEVVVGHYVWTVSPKTLASDWSGWETPNGSAAGSYKVGNDSEEYSYQLLRAQGRNADITPMAVDTDVGYRVRYRISNKSE